MKPIKFLSIVFIIAITAACTLDYTITCNYLVWNFSDPNLTLRANVSNTGNKTTYQTQIEVVVDYMDGSSSKYTTCTLNAGTLNPFSTKDVSTTIYLEHSGAVTILDVDIKSIGFNQSNQPVFH